jgi:AcrR family transcriptional regulator
VVYIPWSMYADGMHAAVPRAAVGQDTRSRLLEAAIQRMAQSGPAVNFDAIAADVGLTKGALYHHFRSVNGLVEEVFKEAVRRHAQRVIEASRIGTGRERLLGLVDASGALYGSGTPFYRLLLRLHIDAGASRAHLAPVARRVQRRQCAYMAELISAGQEDGSIRRDVDAIALAQTVNAALQGLLVQQLEPPEAQRRAAAAFADLLEVLL